MKIKSVVLTLSIMIAVAQVAAVPVPSDFTTDLQLSQDNLALPGAKDSIPFAELVKRERSPEAGFVGNVLDLLFGTAPEPGPYHSVYPVTV
ncbi:MAG: hypothetical protein J3Q66DRAFT_351908 [Benniella sp.]|nr:MAG: hypothetical protein J3Q66DRAFT_351908 [Benniella sp.]